MSNNRSTKFLIQRMKIAKEAGKIHTGEWGTDIRPYLKMAAVCADNGEPLCAMTMDDDIVTAAHIASSDPETTLCDIKEILRLRAENKRLNKMTKILAAGIQPCLVGECCPEGFNGECNRFSPQYIKCGLKYARKAMD